MVNKTVIVSFSSKIDGNCEQIAEFVNESINKRTNALKYNFSDFMIQPCGKCEYQCFADNRACPYIADMEFSLLDTICRSNLTYYVVPNYCDYPCANFFIFNERSQCYFQNHPERLEVYLRVPKRFIVVSNSESMNFREAFLQHTNEEPRIMFVSAKRYGKVSTQADIMTSQEARANIAAFVNAD